MRFYVSCGEGDDGAAGTLAAPFRSLTRARDAIRARRTATQRNKVAETPAAVFIRGGICQLSEPLQLNASDSAVVWSTFEGESVLVSAGIIRGAAGLLVRAPVRHVAGSARSVPATNWAQQEGAAG